MKHIRATEIEKQIAREAKVPNGSRVGLSLRVEGLQGVITDQFVTAGKPFAAALAKYPEYHENLHNLNEVILSGMGSGFGIMHAGAGLLTVTPEGIWFPLRGADAPSFKHAIAIGVGSSISQNEKSTGEIKYPLTTTKLLLETEVVVGKREGDRYAFTIPVFDSLPESEREALETTLMNGIYHTAKKILKAESFQIGFVRMDTKAAIGKFENGFSIEENVAGRTVLQDGLLLAPEKQKDGFTYTFDAVLPFMMDMGWEGFGTPFGMDYEIMANTIDHFDLGTQTNYAKGSPLGRPLLKLGFDGLAAVYSGGRLEAEGTLHQVLSLKYAAGINGRTEDVDIVNQYEAGKTQSMFTGQVENLLRGPYTAMVFGEKRISLGTIREAFAEFMEMVRIDRNGFPEEEIKT
jgi:hypothetical protein